MPRKIYPDYLTDPKNCRNEYIRTYAINEPGSRSAIEMAEGMIRGKAGDSWAVYTGPDGELRWHSNNRCVPQECAEFAHYLGLISEFEVGATRRVREQEQAAFLAEYAKRDMEREVSDEELFELQAAFGPGETVVNVVSGRVTKLLRPNNEAQAP